MSIESVLRQLESEINEARLVNPRCVISRIRQAVESADTLHSQELMQKDLELAKLQSDLTSAQSNAMADARARDFADATGWISVDEQLPDIGQEVLIRIPVCRHFNIESAEYKGNGKFLGCWVDMRGDGCSYKVSEWMPRSSLPKEPSNER